MPGPYAPCEPLTDQLSDHLYKYCSALTLAGRALYQQVKGNAEEPAKADSNSGPVPPINVGEWVWEKKAVRGTFDPRWKGPHQVLLATPYCVAVAARGGGRRWLHLTRTRRAPTPNERTVAQITRDLEEMGDPGSDTVVGGGDGGAAPLRGPQQGGRPGRPPKYNRRIGPFGCPAHMKGYRPLENEDPEGPSNPEERRGRLHPPRSQEQDRRAVFCVIGLGGVASVNYIPNPVL